MDSALANALQKREELLAELQAIEQFVALYNRFAPTENSETEPDRLPEDAAGIIDDAEPTETEKPIGRESRKRGWSKDQLAPHIEQAIRDAGKPLTRGAMLRTLDQRGIPVGGGYDRSKNMGTILWRLKDRFISIPGYGYWLKSEPYGPAEYRPGDASQEGNAEPKSSQDGSERIPQSDFDLIG